MKKSFATFWTLFFPVQIIAFNLLSQYPYFIEHYYSKGIYPYIATAQRWMFGWLPFSIGDLLYASAVFFLARWIFLRFKTKFRNPKHWIIPSIAMLSIIYFAFHLLWGMNYYRLPMHKSLGLNADYTKAELTALSRKLMNEANALQLELTENDSLKVKFTSPKTEIRQKALLGYESISYQFPELDYHRRSVKFSLYSLPLSYMGFNGYLNPFTNEAQINSKIPAFKIPSVTSHEMGHQVGFAKENEANFMACLTAMNHPEAHFRYAGKTFALKYCLRELFRKDECAAQNVLNQLHLGVRKNYWEVRDFHRNFKNPLEPLFKLFYGSFLKANNQPQGIRSYDYVVALLVNYYN